MVVLVIAYGPVGFPPLLSATVILQLGIEIGKVLGMGNETDELLSDRALL